MDGFEMAASILSKLQPRRWLTPPMLLLLGCLGALLVIAHAPAGHFPAFHSWIVTFLACAAGASALGLARAQHRRFRQSVARLVESTQGIAHGGSGARVSLEACDELAPLALTINRISEARKSAESSLQTAYESLELKVAARTAELWRANKALREESAQRERVEGEFYQAQKMDALGKLAGSIAHDFNNLLTVIIGGTESVQRKLGPDHPACALLETVRQAGERAAGLTQPLLTFSRNQVLALDLVDLNAAAEEAGRMLQRLLGINIDLQFKLAPGLRLIKANANQIQQVLVNLGVNARDAMGTNGILTISTSNVPPGESTVDRVLLTVSDTGCGMDAATEARIFEPFFTTKPLGKGTGLGLATVFGIVNQLAGSIEVESAPGLGTTFLIYLPATSEVAIPTPEPTPAAPAPAPGQQQGLLLLVDDEDDIRELASLTLEEHGYQVLAAPHAEAAILLAEEHRGKIRALITDVVMPGIDGVQLAEVVRKVVPDIRVLFVSGHSKEVVASSSLLSANYLQKPYRGQALISKVGEVLASNETRFRASDLEHSVWVN